MVCLVTGSSKNIGKNIILEFAKNNYDVVINYNKSLDEANKLKNYILENYKVKVLAIKCDISNELEVKNMIKKIETELGNIDVLVNNATIELNSEFENKNSETFKKVLNTNLIGTFLVSKYVIEKMIQNKNGSIINITSNNAINKYDPTTLEYDASKAGIISLTHNLALKGAPYINVNAIAPGWVYTDDIKKLDDNLNNEFIKEESKNILLNRFCKMEEIASLTYYLTTNKYINNQVIIIDGGTK